MFPDSVLISLSSIFASAIRGTFKSINSLYIAATVENDSAFPQKIKHRLDSSVVECLPLRCETLGLKPGAAKIDKQKWGFSSEYVASSNKISLEEIFVCCDYSSMTKHDQEKLEAA